MTSDVHVTVEFPTDQLPIVMEFRADAEAALHFAAEAEHLHIAHVHIDDDVTPGLPDMPCQRLWT
ncbi:hypothetical protein [Nocardia sp. BMG51109]|uniref:hypothetical protein n=1 Tax=Nocardia sp. BMG51109 TaxID=1056816 RepID=UPI000462EEF5|nr:hypothetical protein [Nocardia sp. BMG51109]